MTVCSCFVVLFFLLKKAPLVFREVFQEELAPGGLISKLIGIAGKLIKIVFTLLKNPEIIYYIAYGVLAIIGTVVHPFFFAFHLTEILLRYPTLRNVIKSVYIPRLALGLTFVLYLILEYFFVIFGYLFFHEDFNGNCKSTIMCFVKFFDNTFKVIL